MLSSISLEKIVIVFVFTSIFGLTWSSHDGVEMLVALFAVYIIGALIAHWLLSSEPGPSESITNASTPLMP